MDEQKIKNLVKVWYEKAKQERDSFSKFIFLWFCFNAWLAFRTGLQTDWKMLNLLKQKAPVTSDITNVYDRAFESQLFKRRIEDLKNLCPIEDPRRIKPPVRINRITDFPQICEAIYMVRCNLFHGRRTPNENRDLQLVTVVGIILQKWVGNLVNSW